VYHLPARRIIGTSTAVWLARRHDAVARTARRAVIGCSTECGIDSGGEDTGRERVGTSGAGEGIG